MPVGLHICLVLDGLGDGGLLCHFRRFRDLVLHGEARSRPAMPPPPPLAAAPPTTAHLPPSPHPTATPPPLPPLTRLTIGKKAYRWPQINGGHKQAPATAIFLRKLRRVKTVPPLLPFQNSSGR